MATTLKVNEKSTALYYSPTGKPIVDELNNPVGASRMKCILCWIHLEGDPTQYHRSSDNLLDDPNFTLNSDGSFEWNVKPRETELFDLTLALGGTETHRIELRCCWDPENEGSLTNAFATEADSDQVTVTHADHPFAVGDAIFFNPSARVGGLDLGAIYVIREVPDADSYVIQAKHPATSTATGGGEIDWWSNPSTDVFVAQQKVTAADPD